MTLRTAPPPRRTTAPQTASSTAADANETGLPHRAGSSSSNAPAPRLGGRGLKDLAFWSRQLYVLVRGGTPLVQALEAIERQVAAGKWQTVLRDVRVQIDEGLALSEAMGRHPGHFGPVARSLVAAGESSGQLDAMLDRLARLTRQQLRIRRSIVGAMVYPVLLICVAFCVTNGMLIFVLPRFAELFETLDQPLPPTTKVLIMASELLRGHWMAAIVGAVVAVAAFWFAFTSPAGRRGVDALLVRAPWVGPAVRSFETARIVRLLGSLLESRVTLLDALQLTRESTALGPYRQLMESAELAVTRGQSMSGVFRKSPWISTSVGEAMRHGEQSGQVGSLLIDMADFMDEENEIVVRTLTSIIEPLILIMLGAVVAFIALSMFLPLFDLTSMAQGA